MAKEKKTSEKNDSEMMRRFKASPFVVIGSFAILILVVVTFVGGDLLSGGGFGAGGGDLTFGYYDKVPIGYVPGNFFAQYYDMIVRWRQNTMNQDISFMGYQIWREAFEAAAIHTAMLHEMKKSGYTTPAKTVDREVAKLPHFQENGRFSLTLYRQMDDNYRLSLWRQVQDDITKDIFNSDVMGLLKPAAEAEFISRMAFLQRNFAMAVFSVDAYPDTEYTAYAEENSGLFRSVHLSMITVSSSEREAQRVLALIKEGEITFEDAARAHSKDNYADRGGDMGPRTVHELHFDIPEDTVRETVTALAKGEYSAVM
ncbi:MAG: SurA N-terminal domain-containing protein [Treponema sp.]|nr:SurA N-terminal domain-containing protein [Treponema sp.]